MSHQYITTTINYTTIEQEVIDKLKALAKSENKSFSRMVVELIKNHVNGVKNDKITITDTPLNEQLSCIKSIESLVKHNKTSFEYTRLEGQLWRVYETVKQRGRELRQIERLGKPLILK